MKTAVISLLVLAAGAAGGYFLGLGQGKNAASADEAARYQALLAEQESAFASQRAALARAASGDAEGTGIAVPPGFENLSLEDIMNSPGPMGRFQAILASIQNMPRDEIEGALDEIREKMRGGMFDAEKMFAMHLLLTRFGTEDFEGATKYLGGLDVITRGMGTMAVLAAAASIDPKKAIDYFKGDGAEFLNMPRIGGFAAGGVAKEWARQDPDAALAWAKELPAAARGEALQQVVGGIALEDPRKAAGIAMDLEPGRDRTGLVGNIAEKWAASDPAAALAWADSLEGDEASGARRQALAGWADKDPAAASQHLASLDAGPDRDAAVASVGERWARQDPAAAAQWVATQPDGSGRADATRDVMRVWTATEPIEASEWLAAQPVGPSRDKGIVGLADTIGPSDPESSMDWVATISDPQERTRQLENRTRFWMGLDENAASTWIATSNQLSEAERTQLIQNAKPPSLP